MKRYTVFHVDGTTAAQSPLIVCSARASHPATRIDTLEAVCVFARERVSTLINVASGDVVADEPLRALYTALGIDYYTLPLRDIDLSTDAAIATEDDHALMRSLRDKLLAIHARHNRAHGFTRAIMINCHMGCNRSALCAAMLLWHLSAAQPPLVRPWQTMRELIAYMRTEQRAQRTDNVATLINRSFVDFLLDENARSAFS